MDITVTSHGKSLGRFSYPEQIDSVLASRDDLEEVELKLHYDFPLSATLFRESGKQDMVRVDARGREQLFARDGSETPGDLCVTCYNLHDKEVSVDTINVSFRPYEDPAVFKGTVWLTPDKEKMFGTLRIDPRKLGDGVTVSSLVSEAQHEINEKVLRHFAN